MSPESWSSAHVWADALTLLSCASVLGALAWYLTNARRRLVGLMTAGAILSLFLSVFATTTPGRFIVTAVGGEDSAYDRDIVAVLLTIGIAIAVWPLIWKLRSLPSRGDLLAANRLLTGEQARSSTLMDMLRQANQQLEHRVAERTHQLELERRRFEMALAGTGIMVVEQNLDLQYTWVYNPPLVLNGSEMVGRLPEDVLPPSTAAQQRAVKRQVLATGDAVGFEIELPAHDRLAWFEGRAEPIVENGRITGFLTVSIDITRHKQHEREIRDMMRELTHRSKNLMAVIQGIARQTALGADDLSAFLRDFTERLQALSRVHGILVEEFWRGAELSTLIERERHADDRGPRPEILLEGKDFRLSPEAAQNFALALHELFNDAASAPPGQTGTFLHWQENDGRFTLDWYRPGPPSPALISGFGRLFLERHLPVSVNGQAFLTLSEDCTRYRLDAPISSLGHAG